MGVQGAIDPDACLQSGSEVSTDLFQRLDSCTSICDAVREFKKEAFQDIVCSFLCQKQRARELAFVSLL